MKYRDLEREKGGIGKFLCLEGSVDSKWRSMCFSFTYNIINAPIRQRQAERVW